jgi:hypothetical protein
VIGTDVRALDDANRQIFWSLTDRRDAGMGTYGPRDHRRPMTTVSLGIGLAPPALRRPRRNSCLWCWSLLKPSLYIGGNTLILTSDGQELFAQTVVMNKLNSSPEIRGFSPVSVDERRLVLGRLCGPAPRLFGMAHEMSRRFSPANSSERTTRAFRRAVPETGQILKILTVS